jgi:uncharacterized protein (DUF427 family)
LVTVEFAGQQIVHSGAAIRMMETSHPPTFYFPPGDVHVEFLEPCERISFCEFKGQAVYFKLRVGDRISDDAAWSYLNPQPGYEAIAGYFAFYPGKVDRCVVGGQLVTPQPGDFYGGWITPDIVGPFKGGPGTMLW